MDVTHLMESPASSPTRTFRGTSRLYAARCHILRLLPTAVPNRDWSSLRHHWLQSPEKSLILCRGLHLAPFAAKLAVQKLSIRFDLKGACTTRSATDFATLQF